MNKVRGGDTASRCGNLGMEIWGLGDTLSGHIISFPLYFSTGFSNTIDSILLRVGGWLSRPRSKQDLCDVFGRKRKQNGNQHEQCWRPSPFCGLYLRYPRIIGGSAKRNSRFRLVGRRQSVRDLFTGVTTRPCGQCARINQSSSDGGSLSARGDVFVRTSRATTACREPPELPNDNASEHFFRRALTSLYP